MVDAKNNVAESGDAIYARALADAPRLPNGLAWDHFKRMPGWSRLKGLWRYRVTQYGLINQRARLTRDGERVVERQVIERELEIERPFTPDGHRYGCWADCVVYRLGSYTPFKALCTCEGIELLDLPDGGIIDDPDGNKLPEINRARTAPGAYRVIFRDKRD